MRNITTRDWEKLRFEIFETALSSGLIGTYILDAKNKKVYGDESLCSIYGINFSPEGIPLEDYLKSIHPDDLARTTKEREELVSKGVPYEIEYRVISEGHERWVFARARQHQQGDNNLYYGVVVDITDRKLAEEALVKQNLLTKTITDNATVALFMMDKNGYCTFMNPAAEELVGYSFQEIREKPLHYMIHHSHPDGSFYPMQECPIDRALPENFDVRAHEDFFIKKDGTMFPVSCAASPIFDNGVPVATVIEVRDLTKRRQNLETISRKTKNLELLNKIGESISENLNLQTTLQKVTDATTKLTQAEFGAFFHNPNGEDKSLRLYTLAGISREAFEKFGMQQATNVFNSILSNHEVLRVDDIREDPQYFTPYSGPKGLDGFPALASYMAVPVIAKSGKVQGALFFGHSRPGVFSQEAEEMIVSVASQAAIAIDNSRLYEELKKQNQENERLLKLAHESEGRKDEFLSIASHELKTPLTTSKAYVQLASKNLSKEHKAHNFVEKAVEQLDRLEKLVSDLLDVSKIQAGKMLYDMEVFPFEDAIQDTLNNVQLATTSHQIILEKADKVNIKGDRIRLEQVLNNLLTNAVKYSPGAGKVIVKAEVQQDNVIVSVQDFGIGIEKDNLLKIFDRFYRVDNTAMRFQGLGLGLFISSEIIKRHNGSFWIESEPGKGSTFFFLLPINGKQELRNIDGDDKTFYKGNFIEIQYNKEANWLEANWLGYQNFDSVKKGCLIMLDLLKKCGCTKVLNDNTYVLGNWSEAVDWGGEVWFPAMQEAGLKHFAWIYSSSTFARMSAKKSIDISMGQITVQFFTEKEEAITWLEKVG